MSEIVDIPSMVLTKADPGARACIEQATWAIELPDTFHTAFQDLQISLGEPAR